MSKRPHLPMYRHGLILAAAPCSVSASSLLDSPWLLYMLPSLVALVAISTIVAALLYFRRRTPKVASQSPVGNHQAAMLNLATKARHAVDIVPWRIGRGKSNELSIDDHSVSRVHAEINVDERGVFHICDLESLNGVFVNEKRVDIIQLADGDIIDIGDIRFKFEQVPQAASPS